MALWYENKKLLTEAFMKWTFYELKEFSVKEFK